MNQDLIAQRCGDMEVEELVRAVTVERGENTVEFHEAALRELLKKLGLCAHEILRTKEDAYVSCGLSPESSEAEILPAIVAHPILLERPIIVKGNRAVIGRPPENVRELL